MNIEEQVYKKLLDVPKGKITTYGNLAKAVGLKNGQRIIGRIMNKISSEDLEQMYQKLQTEYAATPSEDIQKKLSEISSSD